MNLRAYIARQEGWSRATFGLGKRTEGILKHIDKEQDEVRAKPDDLMEWVDIIILGIDGAWRAGHSPDAIADALLLKQARNISRQWPDHRLFSEDDAIEHVRTIPGVGITNHKPGYDWSPEGGFE